MCFCSIYNWIVLKTFSSVLVYLRVSHHVYRINPIIKNPSRYSLPSHRNLFTFLIHRQAPLNLSNANGANSPPHDQTTRDAETPLRSKLSFRAVRFLGFAGLMALQRLSRRLRSVVVYAPVWPIVSHIRRKSDRNFNSFDKHDVQATGPVLQWFRRQSVMIS